METKRTKRNYIYRMTAGTFRMTELTQIYVPNDGQNKTKNGQNREVQPSAGRRRGNTNIITG